MKNKTVIIVVVAVAALAIIGNLLPKEKNAKATATPAPKDWAQMNNQQKAKATKANMKAEYFVSIDKAIKGSFKFPEEVEYPTLASPISGNTIIMDTANGKVVTIGEVLGKNAFGMKTKYRYEAFGTITDAVINFDSISIRE